MGIFDESSDDDTPTIAQKHKQCSDLTDEEDPLDAYMKSIEHDTAVAAQSKGIKTTIPVSTLNDDDDDEHDDEGGMNFDVEFSPQHLQSKQALESTFRKASSFSQTISEGESTSMSNDTTPTQMPAIRLPLSKHPFPSKFWVGEDTILGHTWRADHDVKLRSIERKYLKSGAGEKSSGFETKQHPTTMDPTLNFQQLSDVFGNNMINEIMSQKYTAPTPVQAQTLPFALSGYNCLITAPTGQGKTLAYIWSVCVHLKNQPPLHQTETGPIALVLVPTRELALQVQKQAKSMLNSVIVGGHTLRSRAVIGGQGKYMLSQELKKTGGIELVIATPGRLLDVISDSKGLSMKRVTFLVLDEADKMLHMGFEQQVNQLLQQIRPDRQTMMLSATMGSRIEKVASEWLQSDFAVRISIGQVGQASGNVEQHVLVLPNESAKETFLIEMLPSLKEVGRTIVFVSTRIKCEYLAELVRSTCDTPVLTLHGDKHQSDRTAAVREFTKGIVTILIATDVAARGLDVSNVQTVLSFDPAKDLDGHVHRLGRTGRLSKETNQSSLGSAYTLLTKANANFAQVLLRSLQREGKAVSAELERLVKTSCRKQDMTATSSIVSKAGLGFIHECSSTTRAVNGGTTSNLTGSIDGEAPSSKRFRNG
jgi:ATP-dependent RNA helicase DDX42